MATGVSALDCFFALKRCELGLAAELHTLFHRSFATLTGTFKNQVALEVYFLARAVFRFWAATSRWLPQWLNALMTICVSVISSIPFLCSGDTEARKALRRSVILAATVPSLCPWATAFLRSLPAFNTFHSSSLSSGSNNSLATSILPAKVRLFHRLEAAANRS